MQLAKQQSTLEQPHKHKVGRQINSEFLILFERTGGQMSSFSKVKGQQQKQKSYPFLTDYYYYNYY